jgi:hypothetical protein
MVVVLVVALGVQVVALVAQEPLVVDLVSLVVELELVLEQQGYLQ